MGFSITRLPFSQITKKEISKIYHNDILSISHRYTKHKRKWRDGL
nr:MAG TPA: hypothetical protein [Caudoviricetes sp.]